MYPIRVQMKNGLRKWRRLVKKKIVIVLALMLVAVQVFAAGNETDWPKKTIQIIVPFAAGGDTDFNARVYATYLTKELGVNVVVSNVTGGGGAIATRKVLDSKPDGYTILFNTSAILVTIVSGAADYTFNDLNFADIAGIRAGDIIAIRSDMNIKTYDELVKYSQKNPGKLRLAITTGAHNHATALLLKKAGLNATLVDAGGTSERMGALLGGHLDIIMNPLGGINDYIKTGKLVALANPIAKRPKYIPDIPTVVESGYNAVNDGYYVWVFPKGTDEAIITKFNAAISKICTTNAEYQEKIKTAYMQEPFFAGKDEAKKLLLDQYKSYEGLTGQF